MAVATLPARFKGAEGTFRLCPTPDPAPGWVCQQPVRHPRYFPLLHPKSQPVEKPIFHADRSPSGTLSFVA